MTKYYKEREIVIKILDEGATYPFIFAKEGISAESRLMGAVKGASPTFVKAHIGADRESDSVMLNVFHIKAYRTVSVDVPVKVSGFISELNDVDTSEDRKTELEEILDTYFSN